MGTELGWTNDGTPSIQALINIQIIKKEAGYPLPGPDHGQAPGKPMTDAEIDAAVEDDLKITEEHLDRSARRKATQ